MAFVNEKKLLEQLRRGLGLMKSKERREGLGLVCGVLFDVAHPVIMRAARDSSLDAEDVTQDFLVEKAEDDNFIRALETSGSPLSLIHRAAVNWFIDCARRSVRIADKPMRIADGETSDIGLERRLELLASRSTEVDQGLDQEELLTAAELGESVSSRRGAFDSLDLDDRILLGVLYVERTALPEEQVELLAKRRGVPTEQVDRELEERRIRRSSRRDQAEERLAFRRHRLLLAQKRIQAVRAAIIERENTGEVGSATLAVPPAAEIRTAKARELSRYSLDALEQYLVDMERIERDRARLFGQAGEEYTKPLPGGADYEEVARIAGLLADTAGEDDRKRVVNSLTQKLLRLQARLRRGESR